MQKKETYPESRISTVKENIHGYENIDHFRWLEGDENGNITDEVIAWTEKQNAFTRNILDNLPGRSELENRIRPLLETGAFSLPVIAGERIFYFRRTGNQNQPVNYYADHLWDEEKVLIDPNQIDPLGLTAIAWLAPSKDGNLVAYGKYHSGDENYNLEIIDMESGHKLAESISGKVVGVYWLPDKSGFIYSRLADVKNPYSRQICLHMLGEKPESDRLIFEQYKEGPLATTWGPFAFLSEDGRWLILGYHTSTRANDLWLADFAQWRQTGRLNLKPIAVGIDATFHAEVLGENVYLYTNHLATNGKILVVGVNEPGIEKAEILIAENPRAVIENWRFTNDCLLVEYLECAATRIAVYSRKGKYLKDIELPGIGRACVSTDYDRSDFLLSYSSFNCPHQVLHIDPESDSIKLWKKLEVPVNLDDIQVSRQWLKSFDGTNVSMFLVSRKNLRRDGNNPTLIYGYGGFAISMVPSFSPLLCPWLEDGGVYAMVNLRGGGEYGDQWHRDGMRDKKTNVYADLEAAAEFLIEQKITSSSKLAVMGRSNGGLLAGAALTRRPELYRAVVCGVPLLDMLRYQNFLMARFWVPEYGSAEDPEEFKWLIEYSPYQKIRDGVAYPATYIHSGENDTRVHPMHARKMTAALQKATCRPMSEPILLWVDRHSGHGEGKPLSIRVLEETDQWIFLRWQLGMLENQ